jgi:lipopolysaccharide cholinephosphotransferase
MNFANIFIDNRESGETQLRQCQLVMLRMLKILDYLCTKHGIEYFLMGGSLLGAIRHEGFIPWDDDLDVGMTRKNYEKFLRYAVPELPADIFFQNQETEPNYPKCHIVEAKLRDKYSSLKHPALKSSKIHDGIMLDIFVYDRAFLPHNFFIYLTNRLLVFFCKESGHYGRQKILKFIERWIPFPWVYSNGFINNRRMIKLGNHYMTKREINNLKRTKFEDADILIPSLWDKCLKRQYGNYMELPPLEKRKGHHSEEPDPFTPCDHPQALNWFDRKKQIQAS